MKAVILSTALAAGLISFGPSRLRAQDTNAAVEAAQMVLSNAMVQAGVFDDSNTAPEEGQDTNSEPAEVSPGSASGTNMTKHVDQRPRGPGVPGRRRSYRRGSSRIDLLGSTTNSAGESDTNQTYYAKFDYNAFRNLIATKNIFDPNRYPHRPGSSRPTSKPRTIDSFTLVGTMSYGKGVFAFFDGTKSEFRKAIKSSDTIAGYKVTNISRDAVELSSGTNQMKLEVGKGMRSEDGGEWTPSNGGENYSASSSSTSTSPSNSASSATSTVPSGPDADILKRLMERRARGE